MDDFQLKLDDHTLVRPLRQGDAEELLEVINTNPGVHRKRGSDGRGS